MPDLTANREVQQAALYARARTSILHYGMAVEPDYRPNWFHKTLCSYLDDWVENKIQRLMIIAPPQHGKSQIVSRFLPGYCFGRYPNRKFLHTSYALDPVRALSLDAQNYMATDAYSAIFPGVTVGDTRYKGKTINRSDQFRIDGNKGQYHAVGVGGPLTSKGGNFMVIDDPFKDDEEARSAKYRERFKRWYNKVFLKRRNAPWSLLMMHTRWHVDDGVGWLLANEPHLWTVLHFPRIQVEQDKHLREHYDPREVGEPLWPERELEETQHTEGVAKTPVRKHYISRADLVAEDIKNYEDDYALNPRDTNCIEQGFPEASEGDIFKAWWFYEDWDGPREVERNRYDSLEELYERFPNLRPFQSWDFSGGSVKETASYAAGGVIAIPRVEGVETFVQLPYEQRGQWDINDMMSGVRRLSADCPKAKKKLYENKACGPAVMQMMRKKFTGWDKFEPQGSKEERAEVAAVFFETGHFLLPSRKLWPTIDDVISELLAFPSEPNDRVDYISQAAIQGPKKAFFVGSV